MSDININIKDHSKEVFNELKNKMPKILEAIGLEAAGNAIDQITELVYNKPESPTYVRTGRLRNSIAWATAKDSGSINTPDNPEDSAPLNAPEEDKVYIGTNVEYAPYVELGTHKMAARPFLKNAIANHTDDYKKIIEDGLKA